MSELIIAVPSKGRLEEKVSALFSEAGMSLVRPARGYEGRIEGLDGVRVFYLSANEIAKRLIAGEIHLGVTGEDLLREQVSDADSAVIFLQKLGFGKADVVLAVPDDIQRDVIEELLNDMANISDEKIRMRSMKDFAAYATNYREYYGRPARVATKYQRIAGEFLGKHGVFNAVTEYSDGATEGAPASGAAEAIVDITSTGDTLRANNLRVLDDGLILKSEANLVASLKANWEDATRFQANTVFQALGSRLQAKNIIKIQIIQSINDYSPISYENDREIIDELYGEFQAIYINNDQFLVPKKNIRKVCEYILERTKYNTILEPQEQKMIHSRDDKLFFDLTIELAVQKSKNK